MAELKILQDRIQQYVNHELPDVQAGFRKGRGTRDQIANICWIMEKGMEEYTINNVDQLKKENIGLLYLNKLVFFFKFKLSNI